jgi:hypothetical protein
VPGRGDDDPPSRRAGGMAERLGGARVVVGDDRDGLGLGSGGHGSSS